MERIRQNQSQHFGAKRLNQITCAVAILFPTNQFQSRNCTLSCPLGPRTIGSIGRRANAATTANAADNSLPLAAGPENAHCLAYEVIGLTDHGHGEEQNKK